MQRLGSPREFRALLSPYRGDPTGSLRVSRPRADLDIVLNRGWAVDVHRPLLQRGRWTTGHLAKDVERAVQNGIPRARVTQQVTDHLVAWVARGLMGGLATEWHPHSAENMQGHPLPVDLWNLATSALERARPPVRVATAMQPWLDEFIHVRRDRLDRFPLDPIARRTFELASGGLTVRELILRSGRGRVGRTRAAWKALDLLLHLDLVWVEACPEIVELLPAAEHPTLIPSVHPPPLWGEEITEDILADEDEDDPFGLHAGHAAPVPTQGLRPIGAAPSADPAPERGAWAGQGARVELPLNALGRLVALHRNLGEASPLARLGLLALEPPTLDEVEDAYDQRVLEFRRDRWLSSGDQAAELAASCRAFLRAARRSLDDDDAVRRQHASRPAAEPDPYDLR